MKQAFGKFSSSLSQAWRNDPRVGQAKDWYQHLPARDQLVVRFIGVLLLIALLFMVFVAPLIKDHRELQATLDKKIDFYELLAENGVLYASGGKGSANGRPLLALVNAEARKGNVTLTRFEQDGADLRVWVDDVGFDDVIAWIETLSRQYGVVTSQITIDRDDKVGRVDVRATFTGGS
ncbi:MAG: type II secretion system protein M [Oleibacter sp.]|nr:type II secretion system protein M [Thalassolituus sp.]